MPNSAVLIKLSRIVDGSYPFSNIPLLCLGPILPYVIKEHPHIAVHRSLKVQEDRRRAKMCVSARVLVNVMVVQRGPKAK